MWVFTTAGYWSAVQDRNDSTLLSVRTRDRQSAEALADGVELVCGVERPLVRTGEGTDYPYRLTMSKADFAAYLTHDITHYLTYKNFKDEAKDSLGKKWADALSSIWFKTWEFTDREGIGHSPYMRAEAWAVGKGYRKARK